jgi:prophage antirepressor-like protein
MTNVTTTTGTTTSALVFQSTTFDVIDQNGQPWLRAPQIAQALGYSDESSINRIYARRAKEFTDSMTCTVKLTDQVQDRETRIFSLRGSHLLGMFARTEIAAQLRNWILDILEGKATRPTLLPTDTITPAQAQHLRELVQLVVETGKQGYPDTWSRLHRKMKVNSYLNLRQDQFDAACQYLKGKFDDTSMAAIAAKHFPQLELPAPAPVERRAQLGRSALRTSASHSAQMCEFPRDACRCNPAQVPRCQRRVARVSHRGGGIKGVKPCVTVSISTRRTS